MIQVHRMACVVGDSLNVQWKLNEGKGTVDKRGRVFLTRLRQSKYILHIRELQKIQENNFQGLERMCVNAC